MASKGKKLKIMFLGGLDEIGKNMTAMEYGDDIIVIDCGVRFPEEEMLGIDLVIPDISYLVKNQHKVRGFVITHGHEDHIGAVPYVIRQVNAPIYGSNLALALIENKLKEHRITNAKLNRVKAGDKLQLGSFNIEFIHVNHSINDAFALAIHTRVGTIIHSGDFKVDFTPVHGTEPINLRKFGELGEKGVLALLMESTNVERPGYSLSEQKVGESFRNLFKDAKGRIIVATFSSNVDRIQQIVDAAVMLDRKVFFAGRSVETIYRIATELGVLKIPKGYAGNIDQINNHKDDKIVLVTTGSQGEPMSGLVRMANDEHQKVGIKQGDLVVLSASPIPGNEKGVSRVIDQLFRKGANVIYESLNEVHASGHACREESKLIHTLVQPKYFIPIHGEHRHLMRHAQLAESLGMPKENIFVAENGACIEMNRNFARVGNPIPTGAVLIDGLGVGDVGNVVLRDRQHLSQDGLVAVVMTLSKENRQLISGPDIISRGFVFVKESEELIENAKDVVRDVLAETSGQKMTDWSAIKMSIRTKLRNYFFDQTKRSPMILPIIIEI